MVWKPNRGENIRKCKLSHIFLGISTGKSRGKKEREEKMKNMRKYPAKTCLIRMALLVIVVEGTA